MDKIDNHAFTLYVNRYGIDSAMKYFKISRNTARSLCMELAIEIRKKGRPALIITPEEANYVRKYKEEANVGYQRMSEVSKRDETSPQKMSEWKMRKLYKEENLCAPKPPPKIPHTKRFVAKYCGQAWHTDLHYLERDDNEEQLYLLAFIDDRSRLILGHSIITEKTCSTTSSVLSSILKKIDTVPQMMIIDNGGEFIGEDFQHVLEEYGIECHHTHPYTPQENGKMERWWQTLEKSKTKPLREPYLTNLIKKYNEEWPHRSLHELTHLKITPKEAYDSMEKFNGQQDASFEYSNP